MRVSMQGLGWTALGLAALAGLFVFAGHVRAGGFYYDDWGVLSAVHFPPPHDGALQALWHLYGRRPGQVAWYAALESVLAYHAHLQLALAALLFVGEVVCVCVLLRRLGMAWLGAAAIAVVVLLFPFSDSLWLWSILTTNTLTAALYLIGVLLALRALDARGWRAIAQHAISLGLYLIGILTYGESFAALGCLVGLLYVRSVGWRRAWRRWSIDVVAIVASLLFTHAMLPKDVVTPYPRLSPHHMWLQAGDIASGGARIIAFAIEPFGAPSVPLVLGGLAGLLALRARDRRWLALAAAGLLVAIGAWVVYVPADYIYSPGSPGTGNRVNGLAAIGIAIFLYAAARLIVRRTELALVLVLVLAAGYIQRISADASAWDRAAAEQGQILTTIRQHVPRPPAYARFFVTDWPQSAGAGVPVYGEPYYLSGALRWAFADRTLAGAQLGPRARLACSARQVIASHLPYAPPLRAGYGRAYLVRVAANKVLALRRGRGCRAG